MLIFSAIQVVTLPRCCLGSVLRPHLTLLFASCIKSSRSLCITVLSSIICVKKYSLDHVSCLLLRFFLLPSPASHLVAGRTGVSEVITSRPTFILGISPFFCLMDGWIIDKNWPCFESMPWKLVNSRPKPSFLLVLTVLLQIQTWLRLMVASCGISETILSTYFIKSDSLFTTVLYPSCYCASCCAPQTMHSIICISIKKH